MDAPHLLLACAAILVVAFLYASVGHAGASGYIAALTLLGFAAASIKPTALVLNVLVACIGTWSFWRAGHFRWPLFWPFAAASVPAAFLGGSLDLPDLLLKRILGVVLLYSAVRLFLRTDDPDDVRPPPRALAGAAGAGIGFLAGITGTGGGIFLTPLVLLMKWARTKQAAAISAPFILVNSASGLAGHVASGQPVPRIAWVLAIAAVLGGALGARLGSRTFSVRLISLLLGAVLVIAGGKLLLST